MKAAALLLAGSMALAACASDEPTGSGGGEGGGGTAPEELRVGLAYDTGGRGDQSFNDSAYGGAAAAVDALGGELQELSPNEDASNRVELLTQLAEQGFNPVIAVGFAYDDVIGEVDRKSTRLNSSHANISYAVFCLKKKQIPTSAIRVQHLSHC